MASCETLVVDEAARFEGESLTRQGDGHDHVTTTGSQGDAGARTDCDAADPT
jgi:hypothetical protein